MYTYIQIQSCTQFDTIIRTERCKKELCEKMLLQSVQINAHFNNNNNYRERELVCL